MPANVQTFSDRDAFWRSVVAYVQKRSEKCSGNFRVAASGGSAAEIFDVLKMSPKSGLHSSQSPDLNIFKHWELWQTDERFIAPDSLDSNQKLLREKIGNASFHPFPILRTPEESAKKYATALHEDADGFLFDLVILGVGPDGHTASLFPHSSALETQALTAHTTTDDFPIHDRLTLTFAALGKSRNILVLLMGPSKKEIFKIITDAKTDFHDYPARKLLDYENAKIWWCET